jgi:hypothetical protein
MDWTSERIIATARDIYRDSGRKTLEEVETEYAEFKENFQKLFYACTAPNFNFQELEMLLRIRDNASRNGTPDIVRDTQVGEHYAKRYVYPITGEPSLEEKKKAAKKIAKKYAENENK